MVAKAAAELVLNTAMATATERSKKLEVPIMPAGAATLNGSFKILGAKYAMKKIKNVCKIKGTAINTMCSGLLMMVLS